MSVGNNIKKRLDILLVEKGLAETRSKAQALILSGRVVVNGRALIKAGTEIPAASILEIVPGARYVSRGGEKLEGALRDFSLSPNGMVCMDIGASTGGFTDCLLQQGAKTVFSVDVGTHQIHDKLKRDSRVVSIEETHILELDPGILQPKPRFVTIDVSFISLKKVLPRLSVFMPSGGTAVALVKPQFEVGPKLLKKGVVRSEAAIQGIVGEMKAFASDLGFKCLNEAPSRLKGPKGNQEFFLHLFVPEVLLENSHAAV